MGKIFFLLTTLLLTTLFFIKNAIADTQNLATDTIDPLKYIDREVYVGLNSGFILSDSRRTATSFVFSGEVHWGLALSLADSFEASFYRYTFKENRVLREDRNNQEAARDNYVHTGMRINWIHYTKNTISRLYPLYEESAKLIPYWTLGMAIEPSFAINDRKHPKYDGDVFWGVGFLQGIGYLNILPKTRWRLKYELGLLESYSPTVRLRFFIEPYLRLKLEYAFSVKRSHDSVEVVVTNKPPLFARDGKTIDELIAEKETTITNLQMQQVIAQNKIINSNVEFINEYNVIFKRQSHLLDLKGIISLNKISSDRATGRAIGKSYTYVVHAYAKFLNNYLDLRPDLPIEESRAYITEKLTELARRRAYLIREFLISNGVSPENIGLRWVVVPEESKFDNAAVTAFVAEQDIVIARNGDSIENQSPASGTSNRSNVLFVGDIMFDLRNNVDKASPQDIITGNSIALRKDGSSLAADTSASFKSLRGDGSLSETTTPSTATTSGATNLTPVATTAATKSTTSPATRGSEVATTGNLYDKYGVSIDTVLKDDVDAGFTDDIVVRPFNLKTGKAINSGVTDIALSSQVLRDQREVAQSHNRIFIFYSGKDVNWSSTSNETMERILHNESDLKQVKLVELRIAKQDNDEFINQVRLEKLRLHFINEKNLDERIVKTIVEDELIGANESNIAIKDYTLALEIVLHF